MLRVPLGCLDDGLWSSRCLVSTGWGCPRDLYPFGVPLLELGRFKAPSRVLLHGKVGQTKQRRLAVPVSPIYTVGSVPYRCGFSERY